MIFLSTIGILALGVGAYRQQLLKDKADSAVNAIRSVDSIQSRQDDIMKAIDHIKDQNERSIQDRSQLRKHIEKLEKEIPE